MFSIGKGNYTSHTLETLKRVPVTPRGTRSQRWKGIQHGELVEGIVEVLQETFSLRPRNPQYTVSPNGAILLGGFSLEDLNGHPLQAPDELQNSMIYSMGFRHGNDSSRRVECAVGGTVCCCSNGMLSGEDKWGHKHTSGFDLSRFVREGLHNLLDRLKQAGKRALGLQRCTITDQDHDHGLLVLARKGILPWRLLEHVEANWRMSGDDADDPFHERNWWSWYNIITDVAKKVPVSGQYQVLNRAFLICEMLSDPSRYQELSQVLDRKLRDDRSWVIETA